MSTAAATPPQTTDALEDLTHEINDLKDGIKRNVYEIGVRLKRIRDDKLYMPRYDSFSKYCKIEVDFDRVHAYHFIGIAESFSCKMILQLGLAKLLEIKKLPKEKRKEAIKTVKKHDLTVKETKDFVASISPQPEDYEYKEIELNTPDDSTIQPAKERTNEGAPKGQSPDDGVGAPVAAEEPPKVDDIKTCDMIVFCKGDREFTFSDLEPPFAEKMWLIGLIKKAVRQEA